MSPNQAGSKPNGNTNIKQLLNDHAVIVGLVDTANAMFQKLPPESATVSTYKIKVS